MAQVAAPHSTGGAHGGIPRNILSRRLSSEHTLMRDTLIALRRASFKDVKSSTIVAVTEDVTDEDPSNIDQVVTAIMDILEKFSLQQHGNNTFMGRDVFSPRVRRHVAAGRRIPMVLPAFPAKSINVIDKVLGASPDLGEELALDRLNDLCSQIGQIYEPGAMVLIATDGACYNDLTGVTDNNLWEYGATLRKMVEEKGYQCIDFVRIMNLVDLHQEATITKERFISLLEPSRRELMDKYGDPNFDANACIKNDPDYKMTYDGYAKFLKKDLAYSVMKGKSISGKKWKAHVHETAKAMIARGVAYAALILEKYPEYVRLSIHPASPKNVTKISMPMIPQSNSFSMTPWHCAVAVDTAGNFRTAHVGELRQTHDVVLKNGQEYFFRERSPLYSWDAKVDFQHFYGRRLIIENASGSVLSEASLSDSDKQKLAALRAAQGHVRLSGFM